MEDNKMRSVKHNMVSVREIKLYPCDSLLKRAEPFGSVGPEVAILAADMMETMEAYEGVGLAAPQVGISKRLIVLREPEKEKCMCLVNPEISEMEGSETAEEGCLSFPQIYAPVTRYTKIHVKALNEHGNPLDFEANGLFARIIQHETDHLDGIVFLDRVDILTREAKLQEWQEIKDQMAANAGGR
jgi:peptide deformylase